MRISNSILVDDGYDIVRNRDECTVTFRYQQQNFRAHFTRAEMSAGFDETVGAIDAASVVFVRTHRDDLITLLICIGDMAECIASLTRGELPAEHSLLKAHRQ
jgi:hypothetical protein